jgi:putative ABC transport system substrate-binding protein
MTRRTLRIIVTLALGFLVPPLATDAQPSGKVHRIGILTPGAETSTPAFEIVRQGLREVGYVEGKNIAFEYRYADGNLDRLAALAAELVRLPVDLLLVAGVASALAAKQATTTIPIVFSGAANPVGRGLVTNLARPGGNLTGVAYDVGPGLGMKRLELLKEAVPTVSRVAILLGQVRSPTYEAAQQEQERMARVLDLTLRHFSVLRPEELTEWVFPALKADAPAIDALYVDGPVVFRQRQQIADFALQNRLPTVGISREMATAGVLLSYEPSRREMQQRTAVLVDKILKGAKPGDLPVEQPTKFELVINLKTAQALGLTIPPTLLFQATEVIR